jgi:hypothetical protein
MEENEIIRAEKLIPPLDNDGKPKLKFDVKMRYLGSEPKDGIEKAIFIDNKILDFRIDVFKFLDSKFKGYNFLVQEQKRIEKEFTRSVSSFLGRKITIEDIKKAILEGWI